MSESKHDFESPTPASAPKATEGGVDWGILTNSDPVDKKKFSKDSVPTSEAEEKSFTETELKRLADITGRVPDDPEIIRLNLVLRYQKFEQLKNLYDSQEEKGILIQQGLKEDLENARHQLDEAMNLTNPFQDLAEREKASQAKLDLKESREKAEFRRALLTRQATGRQTGSFFSNEQKIRSGIENERKAQAESYAKRRATAATEMIASMPEIVKEVQASEIYQTYQYYKDKASSSPISSYHIPTIPEPEKPQPQPTKPDASTPLRTAEQDRQAMIIKNEEKTEERTRTEEYLASKYGQEEQRLEAELDKITESFEFLESKGYLTTAEKNERLDQAMSDTLRKIDAVRAEYEAAKKEELISRYIRVVKAVKDQKSTATKVDETPASTTKAPETPAKAPENPAIVKAKYAANISDTDNQISNIDKKLAYLRQYQEISAKIDDVDKKITELSKVRSESKSKLQPEWQELVEHIKVLPDQGLKFIMAPNNASDSDKSSEYQTWWDHQNDETKRKSLILARYLYSNQAWESSGRGKSFIDWLRHINPGVFK